MSDKETLDLLVEKYNALRNEVGKVIVGQHEAVDRLILSILADGHCLLLGVPGLAKTLMVSTLAQTLGLTFSRIQFTPDLMPSDITGSEVLDADRQFRFVRGPLFAGIVLADEINRTPPKTQAALLEAMQERHVTAHGTTYPLPAPFFVLATQNPIEQEGTYPLPEAQLDRFMLNVRLDYPSFEDEVQIVKRTTAPSVQQVNPVLTAEQIVVFQQTLRRMPVPDAVVEYAVRLVTSTRSANPRHIAWGAGPRASQSLIVAARTYAAMHGRYSPDASDVNQVATDVLRHRIVRSYYAEAEGISTDQIVQNLIEVLH